MTSDEKAHFAIWSAVGSEEPHRFVAPVPAESPESFRGCASAFAELRRDRLPPHSKLGHYCRAGKLAYPAALCVL